MAQEQRVIGPFGANQVKCVDGRSIVSYGTSSYGNDIRCSNEFKVFTNIHSTIVDPRHFDEGSFVDFHDDACIIPPNSFALAHRSPRPAPGPVRRHAAQYLTPGPDTTHRPFVQ